ncbi:hypothetical protein DL95DRAFT_388375 [Leptodontidium sp. 2 PMI_412]|nr:hypothetical protein DL95DRAFT_388375 [Leptodontidium sp. 2 PMI_412]
MTKQSTMADSFTLFPLLPKELRLAIWNLALEPRIVELCFYEDGRDGDENENEDGNEAEDLVNEGGDLSGVRKEGRDIENGTEHEDKDQEAGSQETNNENDNDDDNNSETTSDDSKSNTTHTPVPKRGQFYSPSPLPALLRVNSEARSIAVAASLPGFPVESNKEDVYYNPEIDILYFPAWCWQHDVMGFEEVVGEEVKGRIRRVAVENLMWMSYWEDGTVNGQITISEFKGVKEFIFATRELTQCGCCIDFDGPERELVEFIEIGDEAVEGVEAVVKKVEPVVAAVKDADSEAELDKSNDRLRLGREMEALGVEEQIPKSEVDEEKKSRDFDYTKRYLDRLAEEFQKIKEADEEWNVPKARFVRLMRGGQFAGDP